ncbi:site-specific integrase [Desulfovibrio sp. ZJ200]|uniref:tyrosine-type recombinase/integrase n=1 Tax=Desulfovibrio sp. ZJ200 TaxID=2709792 RepID=UPI0013EAC8C1|nr:site-specific integrase [Desulfovibrio sp. ZJ200]
MPSHIYTSSSQKAAAMPDSRYGRRSKKSLTFDRFVSEVYLPHIQHHKRSHAVDERNARLHLSPAFGGRQLHEITREDVDAWLHGLTERSLAPSTCNRILAVFKSICELAEAKGDLPAGQSPCRGVRPFKILRQRERYLSREEAQRLKENLETSSALEAQALLLLLLTGARKSEILNARWENVYLEQHLLIVPLSKSNKPRYIALSDEAIQIILSLRREESSPWLFPGHAQGKPLSDLYLFWNKLRRRLGLESVRIHDLRHTFASLLVNEGHSLYEVQLLLGHSDPKTTTRYAHLTRSSLIAAAQKISICLARHRRDNGSSRRLSCGTHNNPLLPRSQGKRPILNIYSPDI